MFLRPNSESYQLSCSTTHSSPSFRLLTMFSIFFTHSARKIPASAAAPRTKRSRKRRVLRQQRTFNWTRVCFPRDFVLLWLLTSICQAEEFPVKERTNDGAGGGSRPKLSQGEGRPLPTSKLNLLTWFSKLFCFAFWMRLWCEKCDKRQLTKEAGGCT